MHRPLWSRSVRRPRTAAPRASGHRRPAGTALLVAALAATALLPSTASALTAPGPVTTTAPLAYADSGGRAVQDLAVDADDHSVVALLSSPAALVVSEGSSVSRTIELPVQVGSALAYDSTNDRAYVATSTGGVLTVQVDTSTVQQVQLPSTGLADIAVHSATGRVFVADYSGRQLLVLSDDLEVQHRAALPAAPLEVAVAPDGMRAYVAHEGRAVTFHGGLDFAVQRTVPNASDYAPASALAVSPDGTTLYVGQGSRVAALDSTSGTTTGDVTGMSTPGSLAATQDGRLLVAHDDRVRVYDAATLQQTGVAGVRQARLAADGPTVWAATSFPATLVGVRPSTPPSPLPRVSPTSATVEEGLPVGPCCDYRRASLQVELDTRSPDWVQVAYRLDEPGTASAFDYARRNGTVLVPPGELTADVPLDVFRDGANGEPDETLTLHITGAVGAQVGSASATITITDGGAAQVIPAPTVILSGFDDGTGTAQVTGGPYREGAEAQPFWFYCREADGGDAPACVATLDGRPFASGAELDMTVGTHRVVVTGTNAGGSVTRTLTYTVVPGALPTITIASPADGVHLSVGEVVHASWSCTDTLQLKYCRGIAGAAEPVELQQGDRLPTGTPGRFVLHVHTEDELGNTTSRFVTYHVDAPQPGDLAATVSGGERLTTGATATPAAPVQTSIVVPATVDTSTTSRLTVDAQPAGTGPAGYALLGQQLLIEGPTATAASPYELTFTVDASALGGIAASDVQVFRNGEQLTACTAGTAAVPDPCIVSRGPAADGSGDAVVSVRTSHFSTWTLGRLAYELEGPLQPVDPAPTVNTAKAGAALPVRFRLGGDKGLDVFSSAPRSIVTSCGTGPKDEVELTVSAAASRLLYEPKTQQYVYVFKTDRSWKGCRDLTLVFRDGSRLRTLYALR